MQNFKIEQPPINIGADISLKSFEIIEEELKNYPEKDRFTSDELAVITRLIHTSSCFKEVLNGIYFSKNSIEKIQSMLKNGTKIVVDVNMIRVGISDFYLNSYKNEIICYINEPSIFKKAKEDKTTRSYAAVVEAIKRHRDSSIIFVCGNAPTFIYATINTLLKEGIDLTKIALLLFPVGFVNVIESKEYAKRFIENFDIASIMMEGRFGGSTMAVATLHSIYKLIKDYDEDKRYNGK